MAEAKPRTKLADFTKKLKPNKDIRTLVAGTAIATLALVVGLASLPKRKPYVSINAQSEYVAFRVTREKTAGIALIDALPRGNVIECSRAEQQHNKRLTGRLEPASGAVVSYRFNEGHIAITVLEGPSGSGVMVFNEGDSCPLGGRSTFIIDDLSGGLNPLPIAGPGEIGREYGEPPIPSGKKKHPADHMSSGTLLIYGRSRLIPYVDALYPVSYASFPLPAGGRLSSGDSLDPQSVQNNADPWYGITEIRNDGFKISATTTTSSLMLYRPGAAREAEHFALDAFVGPLSDPSVILLTVLFGIIAMTLKSVGVIVSFLKENR